ncbi:MAG: hypothetical protein Q7W56_10955 [Candidatus Latescibacteria bacterium]|nr:hypothetical protein [Candidatus Latescibacterota bacterium]
MRLRTSLLVIAGFAAIAATAALADDFNPPPWRGGPLTVAAEWEFISSNLLDMPPDYMNTVGDGIHDFNTNCFTHAHFENCYWQPDPQNPNDGRIFTTQEPGRILFFLCNWIDYYPYKYIWVQLTYGGMGTPFVQEVIAPNPGTNEWLNPLYGQLIEKWGTLGYMTEYWYLAFNPDREYVNVILPPNTWIDQVWIDTISTLIIANEDMSWGGIKSLYK